MKAENRRYALMFIPGGVGGAEKMSMTIATFLHNAKYRVGVCVISEKDEQICDFLPDGVEYRHLKAKNQWDFVLWKMYSTIKRERPDVVFVSHYYLIPKIVLVAKLAGRGRIVVRIPSSISFCDRLSRILCQFTIRHTDCVIAQQEEMREELIRTFRLAPEKVVTLHNPVNTEKIDRELLDAKNPFTEKHTVNYLLVASINPVKGHDRLLQAFQTVHLHNPKSRLYFVGKPNEGSPYNALVRQCISDYGLSDCVSICGYDKNPYRWMKYCDCCVLASHTEGLPNVLIEAQYLGIPCAAMGCAPIIDRIISNGVNGYVAPDGDTDALADAMEKAAAMGHVPMTYRPACESDFVSVFDGTI